MSKFSEEMNAGMGELNLYFRQMTILRIFICILALVPFVSCFVDDGSSASEEEEYFDETPRSYTVLVSFDMGLFPDSVYVTFLDKHFRGIETVNAWPQSASGGDWFYSTTPLVVRASYIRIDMVKSVENNGSAMRMFFSGYTKADAYRPRLNIYTALALKTIDRLMKEEYLPYDSAVAVAYANMDDFFGIKKYDYEYMGFRNWGNEVLPYLYCRYFISDSVFYSDFKELADAIDAGEWGDTLFRVRAADEMTRYYNKNGWTQVRGMALYDSNRTIPNFWETAYGMEYCVEERLGDTIAIGNRRSEFYDSVFVCDITRQSYSNTETPYWRPVTSDERKLGICLDGKDDVAESDSTFYHCERNGWQKTEDMTVIINHLHEECNSRTASNVYNFRGTLYTCSSYNYTDSTYANMGYVTTRSKYVWSKDEAAVDSVNPGGVVD